MTPPEATTARPSRGATRRRTAARPPRRASGPAGGVRTVRAPLPAAAGAGSAGAPPLALRLARAGARVGDARLLDRLVRGRGWIVLVAAGLMGIVFMQVSMLRLNAGISRAVTSAETLERQNSALRADISKLDAGERIQDTATALGMVQPPAGDVNYLDARKADGGAAAKAIRKPNPVTVDTPTSAQQAAAVAQAPAGGPAQAVAQSQAQPSQAPAVIAATAPASGQTATQPQATSTQAPAQTQTQAPAQTQTQAPAQTTTQAPATTTTPAAQAQPQAAQPAPAATPGSAPSQGAQ